MKKVLTLLLSFLLLSSILYVSYPSKALRYSLDTNLSNVDASFIGETGADFASRSITGVGDVNGDGLDDFLIGANGNDENGNAAGMAYLIFGNSTGWGMDTLLSNNYVSFFGEAEKDWAGYTVAGAGDVNKDGYNDFLIGAPGPHSQRELFKGKIYLIFGKATGWSNDTNLSNADASFIGEHFGDQAGFSLDGAGDVNGDGFDDFLIGAWYNDEAGDIAGKSYLFFGKTSGWSKNMNLSNADASFIGETSGQFSGRSVAGAGDVNGDNYDDFLIGAHLNDEGGNNRGQVYLIYGKSSGWGASTNLSTINSSFLGVNEIDYFGIPVAGAGDVNGDNYDDILIGASWYDDGFKNNVGITYLFFGKATAWANNTTASSANASFIGEASMDWSGDSVIGVNDVNGDGFDDILIGAYWNNEGGVWARGQSYLILGKSSGWSQNTYLSNADASFLGEGDDDSAGRPVGAAGDVNGDGFDDILIGACLNNEGGVGNRGQGYLIFPELNIKPTTVTSVKAYSDSSYSTEIFSANVGNKVFVELIGTDGDAIKRNIAIVNVTSSVGSPMGFRLRLKETGLNTGIFHGNFTINFRSHDDYRWIEAWGGETVTVSSFQEPAKNTTLSITAPLTLYPLNDNNRTQEDIGYSAHYWSIGWRNVGWTYQTNASWLKWNGTTHNISGIPDNGDVGFYWVRINITNNLGLYTEHNFTLVVNNTPPEIFTNDVLTAIEDIDYLIDYNSSDDDQGSVTWHLETDAGDWLTVQDNSGVLSGISTNEDVGIHFVNISVDDGNGGWDWSNFTLSIINAPPNIIVGNIIETLEDEEYHVDYQSDDDGQGNITWHLEINTGDWLNINSSTGVLNGTPKNEEVGQHNVHVGVDDGNGGWDWSNFTLTVINVNDAPIITTADILIVLEDQEYFVDYNVTDIDISDSVHNWYLETNATWLNISRDTGILRGIPTNDDVGSYFVNIIVKDPHNEIDKHNFLLEVINTNDAPVWVDVPKNITLFDIDKYEFDVNATDIDKGDELRFFINSTPPSSISMNQFSGLIEWELENLGKYLITIGVTDTREAIYYEFSIEVLFYNVQPVATLLLPENGTKIITLNPTFEWTIFDENGDDTTSDLYLSDNISLIINLNQSSKKEYALSNTYYTPTIPLEKGTIYYWTVIPFDGHEFGICDSEIWTVIVSENATANNPPEFITGPPKAAGVGVEYIYRPQAIDEDYDDIITILLKSGPKGMTIEDGIIKWIPEIDQIGEHVVKIGATDGKSTIFQEFIIIVTEKGLANNMPEISSIESVTIEEGDKLSVQISAFDKDGDNLTFIIKKGPQGIEINETGLITWKTKKGDAGIYFVTIGVDDGNLSATRAFKITIKKASTPGVDISGYFLPILLIIILVVLVIALLIRRKRRKGTNITVGRN